MNDLSESRILRTASAGNAEKSDVLVTVSPNPTGGVSIQVKSVVKAFYEDAILAAARETAQEMGVKNARIDLDDFGALDYVIRARVETALLRAAKEEA